MSRILTLSSAGDRLVAQFRAGAGIEGTAHLEVPEVAPLAEGKLQGALTLDADFGTATDGSAVVVLGGAMRKPSSGVAALDRLLGASVAIAATLRRGANGALGASEVSIDGEKLQLAGAAERRADGTTRADVTLSAKGIAAVGIEVDRLEARAALDDLPQPKGRVEARFQSRDIDGTASADATFVPGEALRLTQLHLEAAKTRLDGTLTLDLARARADGTIAATAADLKPWSALLGTPLGGSAELRATLRGGASQSVDATLTGRTLAWGARSAQRLQATLRLADVLGKPTGRGSLTVETATLGDAKVERLTLAGASDRPGRFALTLATRGKLIETFTLGGSATLMLPPPGGELRVTRLAGAFGRETLQLRRPLRVTAGEDAFAFADLDLAFGKGSISGSGASKGETLSLHLLGKGLPVQSMTELANVQGVSGALGFETTLSGTRTHPRGELVLDAEQLRFAADRPDLPPLGFVVRGRWREDRLEAQGRLAGPANAAIGFSAGMPLSFAGQSLMPYMPPQGALALRLEGEGQLASFADLLPVGEDRLAGHFLVAIDVAGTVAAPRASGKLSLRNGRYESRITGTTFAGITFDVVGSRDQLVLQHFAATDGAKGAATLEGVLDLAAAAGASFHLTAGFQNFRAINRDEATATMSGSASLQGSLLAPRLGAQLTILQAEIQVPKQLASNLRPIPVTIIDSATGAVLATPGQSPARAMLLALAFDVDVALPGKVFVRGRGLDSEWRGDLHITGTTAAPSIVGQLSVVHGTYSFLGKTADLNSGTIDFLGGQRIDPTVDITAEASSTGITVIVHITGTATAPKIQLSSQPVLPQDEILSRLLFGTDASKISAGEALELAQAAASLAGGGDLGLLERLRQGLGLDRLMLGSPTTNSVYNGIAAPSTPAGVSNIFAAGATTSAAAPLGAAGGIAGSAGAVNAGKYVADGVYVGVTQGLDAGSSTVDVQIDVTRHISIDTNAGAQTGVGLGVKWKFDY